MTGAQNRCCTLNVINRDSILMKGKAMGNRVSVPIKRVVHKPPPKPNSIITPHQAGTQAQPQAQAQAQAQLHHPRTDLPEAARIHVRHILLIPDPPPPSTSLSVFQQQSHPHSQPTTQLITRILTQLTWHNTTTTTTNTPPNTSTQPQQPPTPFYEFAKKYSICPSSKSGGDLGWIKPGDIVRELEEEVMKMETGYIGVVESRHGIHIVEVLDRVEKESAEHMVTRMNSEGQGGRADGIEQKSEYTRMMEETSASPEYVDMLKAMSKSISSHRWEGVVPDSALQSAQSYSQANQPNGQEGDTKVIDHYGARTQKQKAHMPQQRQYVGDEVPEDVEGMLNQLQMQKMMHAYLLHEASRRDPASEAGSGQGSGEYDIPRLARMFHIKEEEVALMVRYTAPFIVKKVVGGQRMLAVWTEAENVNR